ncbi:MAG TPA: anti-sigma regulatory factor [Polyangiaceae bacterium]|nr:anti-sigma regulatory factor [Polyangiaceae bacterium]
MQQVVFCSSLRDESDVAVARRETRKLAEAQGFSLGAVETLATAVSEIARNVIVHAGTGELVLGLASDRERVGVVVMARDDGPGISNVDEAMRDGFSTRAGLGLGLPSARRLVDDFELQSVPGHGTTVTLRKWMARTQRI